MNNTTTPELSDIQTQRLNTDLARRAAWRVSQETSEFTLTHWEGNYAERIYVKNADGDDMGFIDCDWELGMEWRNDSAPSAVFESVVLEVELFLAMATFDMDAIVAAFDGQETESGLIYEAITKFAVFLMRSRSRALPQARLEEICDAVEDMQDDILG